MAAQKTWRASSEGAGIQKLGKEWSMALKDHRKVTAQKMAGMIGKVRQPGTAKCYCTLPARLEICAA
jgi:hypothetical protein